MQPTQELGLIFREQIVAGVVLLAFSDASYRNSCSYIGTGEKIQFK
jgi:hypothetical protein